MKKIFFIVLIAIGAFVYFKYGNNLPEISYPQIPQALTQLNFDTIKNWSSEVIARYFPDTASQSLVLGEKAKTESLNLLIDAAKQLSPDEFQTLQQFICTPTTK